MSLIAEYRTTARPDRGIVEIYDADDYETDREAAVKARADVIPGNGYHVYLHTLQPDLGVEVAIRVWDGPQDPPPGAEGHTGISQESETGEVAQARCLRRSSLVDRTAGCVIPGSVPVRPPDEDLDTALPGHRISSTRRKTPHPTGAIEQSW